MYQYKKGDHIKLLDDNIKGVVERIEGESVFVENSFGFLEEYHVSEILLDIDLDNEASENQSIEKEQIQIDDIEPKKKVEKIIKSRIEIKNKSEQKKGPKKKYKKVAKPALEIDLHYKNIEFLNPKFNVNSILEKQMIALQERLEKARENGFDKVIVIHGKGEGVLENAVKNFCNDKGYPFYDVDYEKYHKGAIAIELPKNF